MAKYNSSGATPQARTYAASQCPATVRRRRRRNIDGASRAFPELDEFNHQVSAINSRIDKVCLTAHLGYIPANDADDYQSYRYNLFAVPPHICCKAPDSGGGRRPIALRKNQKTQFGQNAKPLFAGYLKTGFFDRTINLSCFLALNPTRAVALFPHMVAGGTEGVLEPERKPTLPRTLDKNSNCLPAWITQEIYMRGEILHFENVFHVLRQTCTGGAEMLEVDLPVDSIRVSNLSLKECEIYWEFHCDDAVGKFNAMEPHLRAYTRTALIRDHAPTEANDIGGKSATIRFSKEESLVVYAKTANRLRFEVRYKEPGTRFVRRRSADNLRGMFGIFTALRQKAAERVNELLSYLRDVVTLLPSTINDWRFHKKWYGNLGHNPASTRLLQQLVRDGNLAIANPTIKEWKLIRTAKRKKLLRYDTSRRVNVPIPISIVSED